MENPEAAKFVIQGFLIGIQCSLMLIFMIVTIIDMKRTKKEWNTTEQWIKSIDTQLKFEKGLVDIMTEQGNRLDKIEEKLGIKEEEDEPTDSKQEM